MPIYRFDIYHTLLGFLSGDASLSYTELYEKLVDKRGKISHRDYSYNLKKMYKERWLSKHDENIRGKRVGISIAPEGKIAYQYAIKLEDLTKINRSFQLLLISASMDMNYLERVIEGHETTSIFDYDPKKGGSAFYNSYTKEGVAAEDFLEKQGRPPNGIFAHLIFQESEKRDLFEFLIEKKLFEKRLIITNGERKHRYVPIESEFKDCIACCITKLYSEVESRMFYIWKTVRRPRRLEKEWFELIHGAEKWQEIEISHFQNRAYINEIEKELKKRKIDPKKTDPKTIDILKRPIVKNGVYVSYMDKKMAQERIDEWDRAIISNYTDLKSDIEKMLKSEKYGYYMNRLLEICLPTFILDEFKEKKLDIE